MCDLESFSKISQIYNLTSSQRNFIMYVGNEQVIPVSG